MIFIFSLYFICYEIKLIKVSNTNNKSNIQQKFRMKNKSITSDTRPSNSQIFNNSSFNRSNNNFMSHNLRECENKEVEFLKIKNQQLKDKVNKMSAHIKELQDDKKNLLAINAKYVKVVNQYYRDLKDQKDISNISVESVGNSGKILAELEKQHRNLVKHCLVMEEEIKNYTQQMDKFHELKAQLNTTNHTNITELIEQLKDLSNQNKYHRKQNNRITFQLEKAKLQNETLKKQRKNQKQQAENNSSEIDKMRALVNTVQQQSKDRSDNYQAKIYQLEIKVEKLQKELRKNQEWVWRNQEMRKKLQIEQVQSIHEKNKLNKDISQLLDVRRRPFISTEKTFIDKSKPFGNKSFTTKKKVLEC